MGGYMGGRPPLGGGLEGGGYKAEDSVEGMAGYAAAGEVLEGAGEGIIGYAEGVSEAKTGEGMTGYTTAGIGFGIERAEEGAS